MLHHIVPRLVARHSHSHCHLRPVFLLDPLQRTRRQPQRVVCRRSLQRLRSAVLQHGKHPRLVVKVAAKLFGDVLLVNVPQKRRPHEIAVENGYLGCGDGVEPALDQRPYR